MATADVVVVGGGVIGTSTAFHLASLGVKRVTLVERRHLAAGASGLDRSPASARLAVAGSRVDPKLLGSIRARCASFPDGAVVRSSSPLERDPRWAGAFATYHEVGADDVETALLGCAASVFSRDVVGRCEQLGVSVRELSMAAVIQPWLRLEGGGTSTVLDDGAVITDSQNIVDWARANPAA